MFDPANLDSPSTPAMTPAKQKKKNPFTKNKTRALLLQCGFDYYSSNNKSYKVQLLESAREDKAWQEFTVEELSQRLEYLRKTYVHSKGKANDNWEYFNDLNDIFKEIKQESDNKIRILYTCGENSDNSNGLKGEEKQVAIEKENENPKHKVPQVLKAVNVNKRKHEIDSTPVQVKVTRIEDPQPSPAGAVIPGRRASDLMSYIKTMVDMQSKQLEMDAKFHVSLLELQKEILKVSTNILNILQVTNDMPPLQANVQEKGPAEEPMK